MIIKVTGRNINDAARIHALSWQESHKAFCTPEFIAKHTIQHQAVYLDNEIKRGETSLSAH